MLIVCLIDYGFLISSEVLTTVNIKWRAFYWKDI